jgi:hypothetical protein
MMSRSVTTALAVFVGFFSMFAMAVNLPAGWAPFVLIPVGSRLRASARNRFRGHSFGIVGDGSKLSSGSSSSSFGAQISSQLVHG